MKKIVCFICIVINAIYSKGQVMVNGDFAANTGNITKTYSCANITWVGPEINTIVNWRIAHGSPEFNTTAYSWLPHFYPNAIWMVDVGGTGHGIHGDYPFVAGQPYIIHLGADFLRNADKIRLVATNLMPPPPSSSPCPIACESPLTYVVGSGHPIVPASFTADANKEEISVPTLMIGDNMILYTPSHNYSHIMVFPFDQTTCYPESTELLLHYLWIYPDCKETVYIPALGSPTPGLALSGVYGDSRNLYVGSGYGTTPSVPVRVHPNRSTDFKATKQITLRDNFVAEVNTGTYFLAQIDPTTCGQKPSQIELDNTIYSKSTSSTDAISGHWRDKIITRSPTQNVEAGITIIPNPNDGVFDITLPGIEDYDITVSNAVGMNVLYSKTSGVTKYSIKLQNAPPGIYFVTISNRQFKEVKRMVLTD